MEKLIQESLKNPLQIRRSKVDQSIFLYYKEVGDYFLCAVIKHLNGDVYIVTAYITVKIKEGEVIWKK